jgi:phosphoribosylformimino-5-aminoimidazole carboxamide ribotide isomerase
VVIFPAIDLIGGQAVRLVRGDYEKKTVYHSSPLEVARGFARDGATELHLVDLEGAKSGNAAQAEVIRQILRESDLSVEIGGGIRTPETVESYLSAGAARVILGTASVTDPDFLRAMVDKYGEKIAVGVDIRDGQVAIRGWTELSSLSCEQFLEEMKSVGVATVICTDISRDGLLSGIDPNWYKGLAKIYPGKLVASGGVTSLDDVRGLRDAGIYGAILGKALYTGHIALADAIRVAKGAEV